MNIWLKAASLGLIGILAYHYLIPRNSNPTMCFRGDCVNLEVADNDISRSKGLMFRESLREDSGMLFIFDSPGDYAFWMKNTLIPLDMIWLDGDLQVVHIEHALPCKGDPCANYEPNHDARYVLEVNGGYTGRHGIVVGERADLRMK
jgi:uncharacterized protein